VRTTVLLIAVAALVATLPASGAQPVRRDLAALARTVLPPGQDGGVSFTKHSTDQIPLYDGLTPLFDRVGARDVRRYFKDARLWRGTERAVRVERPKQGVRILRDGFGVPHIFAATETDLMFGLGWATAADRGVLMELARGPGRLAAIDPPGLDAFALALSGRQFLPSAQTEAALAAQVRWLRAGGAAGRGLLAGIDAFVAGINAYRRAQGLPLAPLEAQRRDRDGGPARPALRRGRRGRGDQGAVPRRARARVRRAGGEVALERPATAAGP
jgi:acyl-homoserine lactone acylase PvdQ